MTEATLEQQAREEIERLHRFFVDWFAGTVDQALLDTQFAPSLDEQLVFVPPEGQAIGRDELLMGFRQAYGLNSDFRIAIRDVKLLRDLGDSLLVSYTEWQRGSRSSANSDNARVTTLVMTKKQPFRWLHLHETWLPQSVRESGDFNF